MDMEEQQDSQYILESEEEMMVNPSSFDDSLTVHHDMQTDHGNPLCTIRLYSKGRAKIISSSNQ